MTTIVASAGQSPDFLQLGPGASASYGAIDLRRAAGAGLQEGVIGASGGAYKVTLSSGMILTIAASTVDGALVQGDTISAQGLYFVPPHSAAILETVSAAHATLPRIDTVVLEVLDANHDGGGSNLARTRIIAGTATSGATLDNRTGAPALPSSATLLADVLVPAAAASIIAGNIRDRRKQAMGALRRIAVSTGGNRTTASATLVAVDATNLNPRLECSGVPIRMTLHGLHTSSASGTQGYAIFVDAVPTDSITTSGALAVAVSGGAQSCPPTMTTIPAAGSHLIGPAWLSSAAGTATLTVSTTFPLTMLIEELIRPSVDNT